MAGVDASAASKRRFIKATSFVNIMTAFVAGAPMASTTASAFNARVRLNVVVAWALVVPLPVPHQLGQQPLASHVSHVIALPEIVAYIGVVGMRKGFAMHRMACCVVVLLAVAACTHPSSTTYNETEVGQTIEMTSASVVSSRIVQVSGEPGYVGAGAGAAVGAVGGATVADGPISLLVGVVGGLVGAGAGYMAEKGLKDRDGIEYVLEMDDGRLVTLVQNRESDEQPLPNGSRVLVQLNGQYARVIANPAVDYDAGGGGWVDPDRAGAAPAPQAGPGAADPGARHLQFRGGDVVEQPGDPASPLTSPPNSGQQQ